VDMMTTALASGEIVREVRIPGGSGQTGSAYLKLAQQASGFAICGAAATVQLDGNGQISSLGIGITGVAARPFRASETEQALIGATPSPQTLRAACDRAANGIVALEDIHASADYRLALARIFARRALERSLERAV